jgi:hypothetical protein
MKRLAPNYARMKIPNTSTASRYTQRKIPKIRIKDEIKHLYIKKTTIKSTDLPLVFDSREYLEKYMTTYPTHN